MKYMMKHIAAWALVVLGGLVSIYVAAQSSGVAIQANIVSLAQYIGSIFVTSDGTPIGQTLFSVDSNGVSVFGLDRQHAGPGLLGLNGAGQMVHTRPLSYVQLPATTAPQQLANNHAYIIPYWDERSETAVILPSSCIIGDQIEIYAMQLPLDMDTVGDMKIVAPYFEGNWDIGYGYGDNNSFVEYQSYSFYNKFGFKLEDWGYSQGAGPDYPYDRCASYRDMDLNTWSYNCGYGVDGSGYLPKVFPSKQISLLCIDTYKYLMNFEFMGLNRRGDFYPIGQDVGYGDQAGGGFPDPFAYGYDGYGDSDK